MTLDIVNYVNINLQKTVDQQEAQIGKQPEKLHHMLPQ